VAGAPAEVILMSDFFVVCRPHSEAEATLEIAGEFVSKDQADRELDRLNVFREPGSPEWSLLVKQAS